MVQPPEPVILNSARKRKIPDADILHAFNNFIDVHEQDDEMIMYIGADRAGNLLEVGVVYSAEGRAVILHTMRARPKYLRLGGDT